MYFEQDFIEMVNQTVDIVDLIGEYTALKPDGVRYSSCCPLPDHAEKDASFKVFTQTNSWYCFGCENGGTPIQFYQMMHGCSFPEAVKALCIKTGINLPNSRYGEIFEHYNKENARFEIALQNNVQGSKDFLYSRGLNDATIKRWGLGANSDNRITFPFYNRYKNILGISLRYIVTPPGCNDKYRHPMNSENYKSFDFLHGSYYKKSEYLYGIHLYDRKDDSPYIYFTEGNLDVILADQYGLSNCFALLGKVFHDYHLDFLKTTGKRPVFIMDNDTAGIKGLHSSCHKCLAHGIIPYVVILDEGKDLADTAVIEKQNLPTYIKSRITQYSFYLIQDALLLYKKELYKFQFPYYQLFSHNLNRLTDEEKKYALSYIQKETGMIL